MEENNKIKKTELKMEKPKKEKGKKLNQKIVFHILAVILIAILCFALTPRTLQNDTYYTVAIGKLISENGVDLKDHFSWHFNLPYTYPHWLYDLCIYFIYAIGNFDAIYISTVALSILLGLSIYYTSCKRTKSETVSMLITLGAMYVIKDFIAARAQLVTFTLLLFVVHFIEQFLQTKKTRYMVGLILLSVAIANIHCAVWPFMFILFLPYIAEYLLCVICDLNLIQTVPQLFYKLRIKLLEKKKKNPEKAQEKIAKCNSKREELEGKKKEAITKREQRREKPFRIKMEKNSAVLLLMIIMVVCILVGFLTPIKDAPFTYLYKTMQGNTTQNINEHLPLTLANNKNMILIVSIFLAIFLFTDTKIKLPDFFMLGGLMVLTFMSRRQESMLVIFGVAILARLITSLIEKYDPEGPEQLQGFLVTLVGKILSIAFIVILSFAIYKPKMNNKIVDDGTYPVEACNYILDNLDVTTMRIYNEYNYGSYLLYRGIPVFIDSRADLYTPEFNGTKNKETKKYEGLDIFSDYLNISGIGTDYKEKFEQYGITHAIMYKNAKLKMLIEKDSDYTQIYEDDRFVIFEKNVNTDFFEGV